MHTLWWVIVGLIAGWATGQIMKGSGFGVTMDIVLGMAGSLNGRFLMQLMGDAHRGGLLYSILAAVAGAVLLTAVARFSIKVARGFRLSSKDAIAGQ